MENARVEINGVKVFPFGSKEELLDYVNDKKGILVAINAGKIHRATEETRKIINNNIGYVDGFGAQYALKKHGHKNAARIPGCELWLDIIRANYKVGSTFFLVGGKQEVIDSVVEKLKMDFPGINIVKYRNGYISEGERKELVEDVAHLKPDYVFVAMGSPKQELLMEEMYKRHKAVYQGLGGSFDVYMGNVKRAPQWFRDHNMEGPYRVLHDIRPARLKRFFSDLTFMFKTFFGIY